MKKTLKLGLCLLLCLSLAFSMSACGASAITEDNITKTVSLVEKALREFDKDTLQKYVNSRTLNYIIKLAGNKEQIDTIGKLLFENVEMTVKSVDTEKQTVTVLVKNKEMSLIAERYTKMLKTRSKGKPAEMLNLLNDDDFLDISVKSLTAQISRATVPDNPTEITLKVKKGKKNLVLQLGEEAEDVLSGGVVSTVTAAFSSTGSETTTKKN